MNQAALKSGDTATKLTLLESLRAKQAALRAGGHKARDRGPKDAFANYTSAADLGFKDEDTQKTSYEIEQELKGRAGEVGGWETVDYEPTGAYSGALDEQGDGEGEDKGEGSSSGPRYDGGYSTGTGEKRKLGQYDLRDEDDPESFDFIRRDEASAAAASTTGAGAYSAGTIPPKRRPKLDPYDEDDWDPRAAIKGKVRPSTATAGTTAAGGAAKPVEAHVKATNFDREAWSGKLELQAGWASGMVFKPGGGWVKAEGAADDVGDEADAAAAQNDDRSAAGEQKPDISALAGDSKPALAGEGETVGIEGALTGIKGADAGTAAVKKEEVAALAPSSGGLFKKRKAPTNPRKK